MNKPVEQLATNALADEIQEMHKLAVAGTHLQSLAGLPEDYQKRLQAVIIEFIQRADHIALEYSEVNKNIEDYIGLIIAYVNDTSDIDTPFVQQLKIIYPEKFISHNVDSESVNKEANELLDWFNSSQEKSPSSLQEQARKFKAEVDAFAEQAHNALHQKNMDYQTLTVLQEKSYDIDNSVNASDLPEPAKRIFLKKTHDFRTEILENHPLFDQLAKIKQLETEILKTKKADPKQVIAFVEKVIQLREAIRTQEQSNGYVNKAFNKMLSESIDNVSAKSRNRIDNASAFTQIKGAFKEKVLNMSSTREKLEHANSTLAKVKYHLNKDLPKQDMPQSNNPTRPRSGKSGG